MKGVNARNVHEGFYTLKERDAAQLSVNKNAVEWLITCSNYNDKNSNNSYANSIVNTEF